MLSFTYACDYNTVDVYFIVNSYFIERKILIMKINFKDVLIL